MTRLALSHKPAAAHYLAPSGDYKSKRNSLTGPPMDSSSGVDLIDFSQPPSSAAYIGEESRRHNSYLHHQLRDASVTGANLAPPSDKGNRRPAGYTQSYSSSSISYRDSFKDRFSEKFNSSSGKILVLYLFEFIFPLLS